MVDDPVVQLPTQAFINVPAKTGALELFNPASIWVGPVSPWPYLNLYCAALPTEKQRLIQVLQHRIADHAETR